MRHKRILRSCRRSRCWYQGTEKGLIIQNNDSDDNGDNIPIHEQGKDRVTAFAFLLFTLDNGVVPIVVVVVVLRRGGRVVGASPTTTTP
jgi:hypothetical protein